MDKCNIGDGIFVAVAYNGIGDRVMTSGDGENWTLEPVSDNTNNWTSVTFGNPTDLGRFVAIAQNSKKSKRIMLKPRSGIAWEVATYIPVISDWQSVTYGYGAKLFVAISSTSIITSPDGNTWTSRSSPLKGVNMLSVCYGYGLFVNMTANNNILTSPNGITWTLKTIRAYNSTQKYSSGGTYNLLCMAFDNQITPEYLLLWHSMIPITALHGH